MKGSHHNENREPWIDAAYELLINSGVEAIKIMPLAKKMNTSRTSFYWLFKDRDDVLDALLKRWEKQNTQALIMRAEQYAASIIEAMLNVCDCWFDGAIFDSEFEYAIRSWGLHDKNVSRQIELADQTRLTALYDMFKRYDYEEIDADTRSRAVYLTQIGYISKHTHENTDLRLSRLKKYMEIFTGQPCGYADLERFVARHSSTFSMTELTSPKQDQTHEPVLEHTQNRRHHRG